MQDSFTKFFIGFLAAILGFTLLPKAVKFTIRTFIALVAGLIGQLVTVVIAALLTEKAANLLASNE